MAGFEKSDGWSTGSERGEGKGGSGMSEKKRERTCTARTKKGKRKKKGGEGRGSQFVGRRVSFSLPVCLPVSSDNQ